MAFKATESFLNVNLSCKNATQVIFILISLMLFFSVLRRQCCPICKHIYSDFSFDCVHNGFRIILKLHRNFLALTILRGTYCPRFKFWIGFSLRKVSTYRNKMQFHNRFNLIVVSLIIFYFRCWPPSSILLNRIYYSTLV